MPGGRKGDLCVPPSGAENLPRRRCPPGPREAEGENLRAENIPFRAAFLRGSGELYGMSFMHSAHVQIPFSKVNPALM